MNLPATSRYAKDGNPVIQVDQATGEEWLGTRTPVELSIADDDRYIKPRPGERVDQFAARAWPQLGDDATRLWWVICEINKIGNPFTGLDPKVALRVPTVDRIQLEVL